MLRSGLLGLAGDDGAGVGLCAAAGITTIEIAAHAVRSATMKPRGIRGAGRDEMGCIPSQTRCTAVGVPR
jgi:hypothetical protein